MQETVSLAVGLVTPTSQLTLGVNRVANVMQGATPRVQSQSKIIANVGKSRVSQDAHVFQIGNLPGHQTLEQRDARLDQSISVVCQLRGVIGRKGPVRSAPVYSEEACQTFARWLLQ